MLEGQVHPDFADVAAVLGRLIPRDRAAGAAVCVYQDGQCVVDIWGGRRNAAGDPWQQDTIAPSFSTTKGVLSTLVHLLVDRGAAGYDDPVARYWPEFGTRGKERITIRHALTHQAGLYRITDLISHPGEMLDWEHMKSRIADAQPVHEPGAGPGYHALTYGWLVGGLIEGIAGRSLREVLREELVVPLSLDGMYIGLPREALARRAELVNGVSRPRSEPEPWRRAVRRWIERALGIAGVELAEFEAALNPFNEPFDWNDESVVQAMIPAANGQFTARSLARMYGLIAGGGALDGVRLLTPERVREMGVIRCRQRDRVLFINMRWRLGYHQAFTFGVRAPDAFGHYGYGGSGAFCDPSRNLAVALVQNFGAGSPMGNSSVPRIARAAIRASDRVR